MWSFACYAQLNTKINPRQQKATLNCAKCFFLFAALVIHFLLSAITASSTYFVSSILFSSFPHFSAHVEHWKRSSHYSALIKSILHGSVLFQHALPPSPLHPSARSLTPINTISRPIKEQSASWGNCSNLCRINWGKVGFSMLGSFRRA